MSRFALLLVSPALVAVPAPTPASVPVRVDPAFELMCTVVRMAGYKEFTNGSCLDYLDAVDAYFGPFRDHPAVAMARTLRKDIGYADLPYLVLRSKGGLAFEPVAWLDQDPGGRWKPSQARAFLKVLADFAKVTRADAFFAAQSAFYRELATQGQACLGPRLEDAWFDRTFGPRRLDTFSLVLMPQVAGNFGPDRPNGRGGRDTFAFLSLEPAARGQRPQVRSGQASVVIHERLHSYVNPWCERHEAALRGPLETLMAPVRPQIKAVGYTTPESILSESMVRAFTLLSHRQRGDLQAAARTAHFETRAGFYWLKPLADRLEALMARPDFRDLETSSGEVIALMATLAQESAALAPTPAQAAAAQLDLLYELGPQLQASTPALQAQDVDPATGTLTFTFDRPMNGKVSVMKADGVCPDFQDQGTWDRDGRVLTLKVALQPATDYRFRFNGPEPGDMKDRAGKPFRPTLVAFRTRA